MKLTSLPMELSDVLLRVLASEYDGNELGKMNTMAHLVVGIQGRSVHSSRPGKLGVGLATVSS